MRRGSRERLHVPVGDLVPVNVVPLGQLVSDLRLEWPPAPPYITDVKTFDEAIQSGRLCSLRI